MLLEIGCKQFEQIVEGPALNDDLARTVPFAERKLRVEQKCSLDLGISEANGDRFSRPIAKKMNLTNAVPDLERARTDCAPQY